MPEVIGASLSPGAGRFRDWIWPDPNNLDNAPNANATSRIAGTSQGTAVASGLGLTNANWRGVDCVSLNSNGAGGSTSLRFDGCMNMHIKTTRLAIPPANDDEHCFRLYCNMAVAALPNINAGAALEMALNVIAADQTGWMTGGSPATGWGLQVSYGAVSVNGIFLVARGPNGLQSVQVYAGDVTQWHSYEFRITSATANADAALELRIDGLVVNLPAAFSSWGAGTNLPPSIVRGNRIGFRPFLGNLDNKVNSLYVSSLRMMSAPSVLALL